MGIPSLIKLTPDVTDWLASGEARGKPVQLFQQRPAILLLLYNHHIYYPSNFYAHQLCRLYFISLQPHVNKRNPISFFVLPLLDGIRLKPQFRVKQQASNVLIETGHRYLRSLML